MPKIKRLEKKKRDYTGNNRVERQKIYATKEWKALSKAYIMQHPLCEECLAKGNITPSQHVHHIVSFMSVDDEVERLALAFDINNLQALCIECHVRKHNKR